METESYTEIETKLAVSSHDPVRRALQRLAAQPIAVQFQSDAYFDTAERRITASDCCLRLRRERDESNERLYLTYKGPKQPGQIKKRREIELTVGNAEQAAQLLAALGYHQVLVVEKERHLWHLEGCQVALDRLAPLGTFVEIEGPDEGTILEVQASLGLKDLPHIGDSYASLLVQRRGASGDA